MLLYCDKNLFFIKKLGAFQNTCGFIRVNVTMKHTRAAFLNTDTARPVVPFAEHYNLNKFL